MATRRQHEAGPRRRRFVAMVVLLLLLALPGVAFAGDAASDPFSLTLGKAYSGPNTASTDEANEPLTPGGPLDCAGRKMGHTRWYKLVGTGQTIRVDTGGSNFSTGLGLYGPAQPPSPATYLGCGLGSLAFASTAGAEYRIQLGGLCSPTCASGTFVIRSIPLPANDARAAAETVNCCYTTNSRSLRWATTEPGEPLSCKGKTISNTIWFRWIAPEEGVVTMTSGNRRTVAAFDEASGKRLECAVTTPLNVEVVKGQSVLAQVGRAADATTYGVTFTTKFAEDRDHDDDGFGRSNDCNDHDPLTNPDAFDRPGDGIDRNCDRTDRPDLVRADIKLYVNAAGKGQPILGISRVHVGKAKRGSKVTVDCVGRACRHREWRRKVRGKAVDIKRPLKKSPRRFKATFVVTVTRGKLIGRASRFVVHYGDRKPRRQNLCLLPGARAPRRCTG